MPRVDGIAATRQLRAAGFEHLAVPSLTTFDLDEYVYGVAARANGFMLKDSPRHALEGVHRRRRRSFRRVPRLISAFLTRLPRRGRH
jgi:DNA-binding NarL/FixJ family response regulator